MSEKVLVDIPRTTLDFYKYEKNGVTYYEFDATECSPPEPMVNAINALRMLKSDSERLVGIFFHEPGPLFERTSKSFEHEIIELESGDVKVVFKKR